MRVLHVASECAPFARSGGLGDVVGALPSAQREVGADAVAVLPLYRAAADSLRRLGLDAVDTGVSVRVDLGAASPVVRFLRVDRPGRAPTLFAACDEAFDRDGLYGHHDDGLRFVLFGRAVVQALPALPGGPFQVVHAHDWHAGLVPALLATTGRHLRGDAATVQTLHTLAYQGVFAKELLTVTGLPWEVFRPEVAEFWDHLGLLKAGVSLADAVTTVSPTYAREILTPAFGHNLDGFLRRFRVHGILNGVDETVWSPTVDDRIAARFSVDDLAGKAGCRTALHEECAWDERVGVPVLGVVSRMTSQKGLDLVAELVPRLDELGARLVVLGNGEARLEGWFIDLARRFPDRIRVKIGFDDALSHRVIAGSDMLLVPSRFEPCGLTQMYAMAYGTVPVVHATGGLADTVEDPGDDGLARGLGTGFAFRHPTTEGLWWALGRAVGFYRYAPPAWHTILTAGMGRDHSWGRSARAYLALYASLRA